MSAKKKTKTPSPAKRGGAKAEPAAKRPSARALHSVDNDEAHGAEPAHGKGHKHMAAPKVPPPPELETVFTPVEIDFFERAADMYADEYDVWADFRPKALN